MVVAPWRAIDLVAARAANMIELFVVVCRWKMESVE